MKVLFAASEAVPFAKTGGLADVSGSLPKYLNKLGADIRVVIPKYRSIPVQYLDKAEPLASFIVNVGWRHQPCNVLRVEHEGVLFYLLENSYYFDRDGLYGHYDQAEQFTFFSRAVLELLPQIGFKPDIIHCNDWQTGVVSLLLSAQYKSKDYFSYIKTIFTIHNLKYQGVFPKETLNDLLGLGWEYFTVEKVEFYDQVNFMKAGLVYSDVITTVSKTYANEIKYDFFGENLSDVIRRRSNDLYGIINGIDFEANDPATDSRLFANYDSENINGKYINKSMLQESLGLPVDKDIPVIGIISRLVDHKGFDLIACVLDEILSENIQLVVLGSGDYAFEEMFRHASARYPQKVSCNIKYDATLAQRIFAGSDMLLMPSLFEPCGLTQLFGLRYGAIPIVRETGGLKDTIQSYNEFNGEGNGFSFANYNAHDMLYTIRRAIAFYHNPDIWSMLVRRAMKLDYSWDKSAREYLKLYENLCKRL
ncbi:MAG: glycogen synthase GlgA [Clostridia bacterium]|nr:glycogen synthase GlgA [Clostridia bacterium]